MNEGVFVRKIRGFLFLVSWTSELIVRQIERLWHMDGRWRMEFCHVLTVLVDIIMSFDSARQILGGILQVDEKLLVMRKLGTRSCLSWFVALRIVQQIFCGVGTGGMVRGTMTIFHA